MALSVGADADAPKAHVTVVSIVASNKDTTIDEKAQEIAREVHKKSPELIGFRIATTTGRTIPMGSKESFGTVDENEVVIEVSPAEDDTVRYAVQVKVPTVSSLSYKCVGGKFFPIVTGYETKNGERLIIAVMVEEPKKKGSK